MSQPRLFEFEIVRKGSAGFLRLDIVPLLAPVGIEVQLASVRVGGKWIDIVVARVTLETVRIEANLGFRSRNELGVDLGFLVIVSQVEEEILR